MELLEKTQGWKEEAFDVVLQFMRTVLLKRKEPSIFSNCSQKEADWITRRRRIPYLYHPFHVYATTESYTLEPGDPFLAQETSAQTQRH